MMHLIGISVILKHFISFEKGVTLHRLDGIEARTMTCYNESTEVV
jgi:hypothetical protein